MSTGIRGRTPTSAAYLKVERSEEFAELRKAHRRFVFPMTVAFFVWSMWRWC
jgi:uncharacterized membrane protein (DUF485 family)